MLCTLSAGKAVELSLLVLDSLLSGQVFELQKWLLLNRNTTERRELGGYLRGEL